MRLKKKEVIVISQKTWRPLKLYRSIRALLAWQQTTIILTFFYSLMTVLPSINNYFDSDDTRFLYISPVFLGVLVIGVGYLIKLINLMKCYITWCNNPIRHSFFRDKNDKSMIC